MMTPRTFQKIGIKLMAELMARGPVHILMAHQKEIFRDYMEVAEGIICEPIGVVENKIWTNCCRLIVVPKE